jgi:hypothetical protein
LIAFARAVREWREFQQRKERKRWMIFCAHSHRVVYFVDVCTELDFYSISLPPPPFIFPYFIHLKKFDGVAAVHLFLIFSVRGGGKNFSPARYR